MRVGFDARWYNRGGVGTYIAELLKAFGQLPEKFECFVYEDPANPVPRLNGGQVVRVPVRASTFSAAGELELRRHSRQLQLDVFHCPYQYGVPLMLACPLVITIHDLIPFLFRTRSWPKQLLAIPLVKAGYRFAAARASHIIADSEATARDVERILHVPSGRITPIRLAASKDQFHENGNASEMQDLYAKYEIRQPYVVVGSPGCNWRTKNLETALRALELAQRKSTVDFQTVVYGPSTGLQRFSKRNRTFDLEIRQAGFVPVKDLGALFRYAQLFITASLYEGFGLPLLEAMMCGCPVVSSNAGSLAEVAGSAAMLLDPLDVHGMAEAVLKLLCEPKENQLWRSRSLARAAQFSWSKTAEQTAAVYRRVCNSEYGNPALRNAQNLSAAQNQRIA